MRSGFLRRFSWEMLLAVLLCVAVLTAVLLSPLYLDFDQIMYSLQQSIAIVGVLGIGFMMVIIIGEIDISLPAILAIGTVLLARLSKAGVPLWQALPLVLVIGALAGALNGFLVATFNLPSLAVTLGTMYAYRGIALLSGGFEGYAADVFQPSFIWVGSGMIGGKVPASLVLLLLLFLVFAFVMHRTVYGRLLYAVGNNRVATRFSGHNVKRIILSAYTLAGILAGLGALVYVGQFQSARADNASQLLLFVVACVVLGGFDIFGGKGNVVGLAFSLLIIGTIQNGMGLANVPGPVQTLVIGLLIIVALLIPAVIRETREAIRKNRMESRACSDSDTPMLSGPSPEVRIVTNPMRNEVPRLELCDVSKSFGGINALREVSFRVLPGEIHALVGENGAGKSTLVKIITGLLSPDAGVVLLDGQPIRFDNPMTARRAGVLAVYQDPKLFPNLDVAENVFMGIHPVRKSGIIDRAGMYARTREILRPFNVELNPRALVASLSTAEMQFVEFARALCQGVERLLILDEPTATLSPKETDLLFSIVRELRNRGTSVLLISHRLEELTGVADTISILRDGEHVATRRADTLSQDEIVKLMVGRTLEELYGGDHPGETGLQAAPNVGPEMLRVQQLGVTGEFSDISFSVRAGEIVCLAGLVGAGRTEIAQTIFGIAAPDRGQVYVDGQEVTGASPRRMLEAGVAYVPENRETEGLIVQLSVIKNIALPNLDQLSRLGVMDMYQERDVAQRLEKDLQIKTASLDSVVSSLSGGNRQKVVLAKWLAQEPKMLILDETTHGIDVGTKAHVHQLISKLASKGLGILMISSDLPEVLRMSDRIIVIADGKLVAEFSRAEATQEKIMLAAATGKGGGNRDKGKAGASSAQNTFGG